MTASVRCLECLDFTFAPWSWPFADDRRSEIDAFFRRECENNPRLWNGRLLLLRDARIAQGTMAGSFFETDYASLLASLAWGAMETPVKACLPAAALIGSDGDLIVGEMAAPVTLGNFCFQRARWSAATWSATVWTFSARSGANSWKKPASGRIA
jgi:hypothetical protein